MYFELQRGPAGYRWVLWPSGVPAPAENAAVGRWCATKAKCLESIERFRAAVAAAPVKEGR